MDESRNISVYDRKDQDFMPFLDLRRETYAIQGLTDSRVAPLNKRRPHEDVLQEETFWDIAMFLPTQSRSL